MVVGVIVGIALLGIAYIYFASWREKTRQYASKEPAPTLPTDAAEIAEGGRLARIHGCLACHGEALTGNVIVEIPNRCDLPVPAVAAGELITAASSSTQAWKGQHDHL